MPSSGESRAKRTINKLAGFVTRGFLIASSYRLNFAGTYFGSLLYVSFYALLARFIGQAPAGVREYGDYFTYLLIGSAFMRYLSLGMKHLSRELEHEIVAGTVEPLLVTATSPTFSLLGVSAWILVEGLLVLALELATGTFVFGADLSRASWPAAALIAFLTLTVLSSWGVLSAAFLLVFKRADPLNWFVDLTSFIFAGVYFPIALLPAWIRPISFLLPLTYALEGLRRALMLGTGLAELQVTVAILLLFNVLFIPFAFVAFRRALAHSLRVGNLGQY